jgi:hypothetical protein
MESALESNSTILATSILNAYISKNQNRSPWFTVDNPTIGPLESGFSANVTLTPNSSGITRIIGTYTETLSVVSQNASNSPVTVSVIMNVTS